jgi:hypothetical protein
MTVGRFLCHLEEDPTQVAFMRMYYQIPITGTEDADLTTLSQQIQPHEVCGELEAFKQLMSRGCSSVPRFLGYCEKMQGEYGLVPGGYVKYLVWEKVPGEPLTEEFFWSLGPLVREEIRAKFRVAYESVYASPRWQTDKTLIQTTGRCCVAVYNQSSLESRRSSMISPLARCTLRILHILGIFLMSSVAFRGFEWDGQSVIQFNGQTPFISRTRWLSHAMIGTGVLA